jgi:hypothetical protein
MLNTVNNVADIMRQKRLNDHTPKRTVVVRLGWLLSMFGLVRAH